MRADAARHALLERGRPAADGWWTRGRSYILMTAPAPVGLALPGCVPPCFCGRARFSMLLVRLACLGVCGRLLLGVRFPLLGLLLLGDLLLPAELDHLRGAGGGTDKPAGGSWGAAAGAAGGASGEAASACMRELVTAVYVWWGVGAC